MEKDEAREELIASYKAFKRAMGVYRAAARSYPEFLLDGPAPELPRKLLDECRVLPSRSHILSELPKGGVCAEVGTQTGVYARKILDEIQPDRLYLLDMTFKAFEHKFVAEELDSGLVELREGLSWELLSAFDDHSLDFAYVDAGHSYSMVQKDLEQAVRKVKPGGYIVCNDFTLWSPTEAIPYGVYKAVCELMLEHDLSMAYLALHPLGFHDVAIRCN